MENTLALTVAHKANRLAWAKRMVVTPKEGWERTVFSDEKKFNLDGTDGLQSFDMACGGRQERRSGGRMRIKRRPERNIGFYASLSVSVGISLKMPPRSPAFPTCRHSSLKSVASTLKSTVMLTSVLPIRTPYVPIVSAANMLKLVASTIKYVGSSVFSRSVFSSSAFSSSVFSTSVSRRLCS
ncbi:hypothetical protein PR003_g5052 [Phytophthora rubi]|uniref:Uncharacterized protein n=1 Tax=Phytophthora rubi TaxID=129364 RepID=A0A6A4G3X8_9STRA|nr:hypothetical protein PR003_g5052 [Phytophthora rubi]